NDIPFSETVWGRFKISLENLLLSNIAPQATILRLPMVLGNNYPEIIHLRQCIRHQAAYEVFPNLVVSITTINKSCEQDQFILHKSCSGMLHLSSIDRIHTDNLFKEIASKMGDKMPIFKSVFSSNEDRFFAILPKENKLPNSKQMTTAEGAEECN